MNKSDLKDGMVVELRNGRRLLVMDDLLFDKKFIKEVELDEFTNTLFYIGSNKEFDIIKVYENVRAFIEINCMPIWEREEIDWNKIPFGTKVVCWNDNNRKYEGKFLGHDPDGTHKYIIFVDVEHITDWKNCELVEELTEVTEDEIYEKYDEYVYSGECKEDGLLKSVGEFILENYNVTRK